MSYGPKLPLDHADSHGYYGLIDSIKELAKQNMKMVILTSPSERIMNPDFGVGVRKYLFENGIFGLEERIRSQCSAYVPFVSIRNIQIDIDPDTNSGAIMIEYIVKSYNIKDVLKLLI